MTFDSRSILQICLYLTAKLKIKFGITKLLSFFFYKKDVSQLLYVMMIFPIIVLFCKKNALFFYQFENYD